MELPTAGATSMFSSLTMSRSSLRGNRLLLFLPLLATAGCASVYTVRRLTVPPHPWVAPPAIVWHAPVASKDATHLSRWRAAVGPPVLRGAAPRPIAVDAVTVVTWNVALGAGDLRAFVATLPPGGPLVLLLQEVVRSGPEVPAVLPDGAVAARAQGGRRLPRYRDVAEAAAELGLSFYYVPSMRNGSPRESDEDRGNAILSSLPLEDPAAIELPFERQRRVAVAATIRGLSGGAAPWRLRVVSAHLDNTFNPLRLSLASEFGRTRQARGLLEVLGNESPLILGGDFNTWSGFSDQAFRTIARHFPPARVHDRRATFLGVLRLDHLFFRLPGGWDQAVRRAGSRFGSDHYPLVGTVQVR